MKITGEESKKQMTGKVCNKLLTNALGNTSPQPGKKWRKKKLLDVCCVRTNHWAATNPHNPPNIKQIFVSSWGRCSKAKKCVASIVSEEDKREWVSDQQKKCWVRWLICPTKKKIKKIEILRFTSDRSQKMPVVKLHRLAQACPFATTSH